MTASALSCASPGNAQHFVACPAALACGACVSRGLGICPAVQLSGSSSALCRPHSRNFLYMHYLIFIPTEPNRPLRCLFAGGHFRQYDVTFLLAAPFPRTTMSCCPVGLAAIRSQEDAEHSHHLPAEEAMNCSFVYWWLLE